MPSAGASLAAFLAAATLIAGAEARPPLHVGDPAPRLSGLKWLRGTGPEGWQPGHVYVLDFWATWCAPCLTQMPAHQELQDRYADRDVHLLGIALWSEDGPLTPAQAMEEYRGLTYPLAEDVGDRAAEMFMARTSTNGLPAMMVVDDEGRLAWVGEPGEELETTLEALLDGTFDLAASREKDRLRRRSEELFAEIDELRRAGEPHRAAARVDDVIALDPESNGWAWGMKYEILLVDAGDAAAAGAVAAGFLSSAAGGNAYFNYVFSLRVVLALKRVPPSPETLDLALLLARRGTELDDAPDARRFSNVASVFDLRGDPAEAARWQRRAVDAAPPAQREAHVATLREYETRR